VKTLTDNNKRELFMFREQDVQSRPGLNVVLTIDARIQQILEEELAPLMAKHSPESAIGLVVRPKTGEILAMANFPTFDPNLRGRDAAARRNRIITDAFEPGSTAKTLTLAAALNEGVTKLTDQYDCENGAYYFAGRTLHDHENYRVMTVQNIIAKSSNIGTAKVAIRMGQELTYRYFKEFGFGQRTGIPLTGEASGYLPPLKYWKPIHVSRISIGHGVSATPLQTVMAMCAVANGGVLMRPMLVDSLVDEHGNTVAKYQPQVSRRVISESVARTTTEALKSVVDKGTAEKAALEHYTVAGKTGTAQKVVNGQYSHDKYYISFIGFFPASDPELCVLVAVDEPVKKTGYYGGQVAAPVFKRISERAANYLNLKPDIEPPQPDEGVLASGKLPERPAVTQVR
jgi:cell division protein FtsI/penicillin-binding protein 2